MIHIDKFERFSETIEVCSCCKEELQRNSHSISDMTICDDCVVHFSEKCYCCGEREPIENMNQNISVDDNGRIVTGKSICNHCLENEVKDGFGFIFSCELNAKK